MVFSCGLCGKEYAVLVLQASRNRPWRWPPLRQSSISTGAGTAASGSATSTLTKIAACAPGARPASAPPAALGFPPETNFVPSAAPSSLSPAAVPEPSKEKRRPLFLLSADCPAGPFLLCMRHRLGDRKRHRDPLHPRCGKAIPRTSVRNHIGWLFGDGGMGVAILIWLAGTGLANSSWTAPWAIATSAAWSAVQAPALEPSGALPTGLSGGLTVKFAFIDSLIMVKMMTSYLEAAPATQITFDRYGKLSAMSSGFQEPFQKGQQENPSPACAEAAAADKTFCPSCGAPLPEQTAAAWTACWTRSTAAEAQTTANSTCPLRGILFSLFLSPVQTQPHPARLAWPGPCAPHESGPPNTSLFLPDPGNLYLAGKRSFPILSGG